MNPHSHSNKASSLANLFDLSVLENHSKITQLRHLARLFKISHKALGHKFRKYCEFEQEHAKPGEFTMILSKIYVSTSLSEHVSFQKSRVLC